MKITQRHAAINPTHTKRPSKAAFGPTSACKRAASAPAAHPAKFARVEDGARETAKQSTKYQQKMAQLEEEIALLTSYSSDTIYRLRFAEMKYDYISPSVVRLLGFSVEEMKRINFRSLILETRMVTNGMRKLESFDDLERKRQQGDVNKWQADYLMRTKDGRNIWISDVSHPWFDEKGKIIGSVGSMRDITDRVHAEQSAKEELQKIANTDALTGIANRREFFTDVEKELRRIKRSETELSMLLIDIDHFKNVNDSYGHDVGDAILIQMAELLKTTVRDTDLVARLGGEEFGVLLPETNTQGALYVAERLRAIIAKYPFTMGTDKAPLRVSVSVGVAGANAKENRTATDIYKLADTRLYIAKNTGRNQVSVDDVLVTH